MGWDRFGLAEPPSNQPDHRLPTRGGKLELAVLAGRPLLALHAFAAAAMALHPNFPSSPCTALVPEQRWFPAAEELRGTAYEKLLPPLVAKIRTEIHAWRDAGYTIAVKVIDVFGNYP
jgi:hypothetical protein